MSHLINAFPIGRLGNQLFQVAALIGYAKKYNVQWGFPSDTREVPHLRKMFPNIPVLDGNFRRANYADPSQFNYNPLPNFERDTTLVGFWQSEKYFEGADADVKKLFKLNIQPNESISLHIRRGDYLIHPNSFPPVNLDYVRKALEVLSQTTITDVVVFSDDIAWCRGVLPSAFSYYSFNFSEGRNEFEDLSLMASCKHNIIANSTFSFWGAWLNPENSKIVVSPSMHNWFGPGFTGGVPKDLIPNSWQQIHFR